MTEQPDLAAVSAYIMEALRSTPTRASTRFSLAEGLRDRYPAVNLDEARSLVGRALVTLQDSERVGVLRPESWDLSGDERVRLASSQ